MVLKISDIEIHSYDKTNEEHRHLKYVLENDFLFRKYVTKNIEERLEEPIHFEDRLEFNHSYFVKYKEDYIGYIRLEELKWNGDLHIEWAISSEFRNQKLGQKVILLLSDYLLKSYEEIKKVKGVIEKNNYSSKNAALQAGFLEEDKDDMYIYVSKGR